MRVCFHHGGTYFAALRRLHSYLSSRKRGPLSTNNERKSDFHPVAAPVGPLLSLSTIKFRSMCKLWTTADLTLCTASIVSLCAISVDRYLVITRPLRYSAMRTTARMLAYIAIVWVIAAVVSISSHIIANLLDTEKSEDRVCQVIF